MGFAALAVFFVATTAYSIDQSEKGRSARNKAADKQKQAQQEQKAQLAQQAAAERRTKIREERVRRARILQAGQNTGTAGSSGEFGAMSGLATDLSSNLGFNLGQLQSANNRSDLLQGAADFGNEASNFMVNSQYGSQLANLSMSIFGAMGKAPSTTSTPGGGNQLAVYPSPQAGP